MTKIPIFYAAVVCVLSLASCTKDTGRLITAAPVSVNFCDTITFSKHIKPIIDNSCAYTGCHVSGGTGSGDFSNYAGIKDKVDNGQFRLRVVEAIPSPMPASGMLPADQITLIRCWLDKGAKND